MVEAKDRSRSPVRNGGALEKPLTVEALNENSHFGALVTSKISARRILTSAADQKFLYRTWQEHGGLLVLRGLEELTAGQGDLMMKRSPSLTIEQ
eukprot:symbB.v1.2.004408.t1/scaffold247.1/size253962/8